jgi:hypothetical protein
MRANPDSTEGRMHSSSTARTDRHRAPPAMVVVGPATETDSDATWAAFLLSRGSPVRARDFARAMAERTAWDIELDWHDHWERVAALLTDDAAVSRWAPMPDAAVPAGTGPFVVPCQQRACVARDGSMQPG